jgi:transketolase
MGGLVWEALKDFSLSERPEVWVLTEMPLAAMPREILQTLNDSKKLAIVEEHVAQGGLGMQCAYLLAEKGIVLHKFIHRFALRYPSGRYGSQNFHRTESGMDIKGIQNMVLRELNAQ